MLILTRRLGEKIFIGDDIAIEILSIRGNQVRMGVAAPDKIKVVREELLDRKKKSPSKNGNLVHTYDKKTT